MASKPCMSAYKGSVMDEMKQIESTVGKYLEGMALALEAVTPEEKDLTLSEVESHIYEDLKRRTKGQPSMAALAMVLAEMPPPSSFARDESARPSPGGVTSSYPAAGAALAILGLLAAGLIFSTWGVGYSFINVAGLLAASLALPLAATALGFMGISRIRAARGKLIGMPLAVGVSLFYPLAILDAAFSGLVLTALVLTTEIYHLHDSSLVQLTVYVPILLVSFLAVLFSNAYLVRRVWRWANRPLEEGEFA